MTHQHRKTINARRPKSKTFRKTIAPLAATQAWTAVLPEHFVSKRPQSPIENIFDELADRWRKETWFMSSTKKRIANEAYLSIIGLGIPAVPLILRELERTPDHWFAALQAITRSDPAPLDADFEKMRDAWVQWGILNGFLE